ncbi:MAG: ELWxxDGT repeat protein [Bacteroidota bacterium]
MKTTSFILLFILNIFILPVCFSQNFKIELVKVINDSGSAYPADFVIFKNKLVFTAADAAHGMEPWISDGTTAGTMMLKNINQTGIVPGGDDGSEPSELTVVGDQLFFSANDNVHWYELWVTDGTEAGTRMVSDILPGSLGSNPHDLAPFNGRLIFGADGPGGDEPWISDGTQAGTYIIKNISITGAFPSGFFEFDSIAYFSARDITYSDQLWRTNGTEQGTYMLKNLNSQQGQSSLPHGFTRMGNRFYFNANSGANGWELFVSDGTGAGTNLFARVNTVTAGGSYPMNLFVYKTRLYFSADDGVNGRQLWSVSSDPSDLKMVKLINPQGNSDPGNFTVYKGLLYFSAADTTGKELWVTDGTETGTHMVSDINIYGDANPQWLTVFGGKLFFSAAGLLWYTDGSDTGTVQIGNDTIGLESNYVTNLVVYNNSLYFAAQYDNSGIQFYKCSVNSSSIAPGPSSKMAARVYPNPCSEMIHVSIDKAEPDTRLEIIDQQGMVVYNSPPGQWVDGTLSISTSSFVKGLYCLRVISGTKTEVVKFIKN